MSGFVESQRFRQWWFWAIMGLSLLLYVVPLTAIDAWTTPVSWFGTASLAGVFWLVYVWRLDTRCDAQGIYYRVWPFMHWRTIRWADVATATVTKYGFVGYGIRWNFGEWVYNVAGSQGLRIITTNGKRVLIGTQRPDDLRAFLATRPVS